MQYGERALAVRQKTCAPFTIFALKMHPCDFVAQQLEEEAALTFP